MIQQWDFYEHRLALFFNKLSSRRFCKKKIATCKTKLHSIYYNTTHLSKVGNNIYAKLFVPKHDPTSSPHPYHRRHNRKQENKRMVEKSKRIKKSGLG